MASKPVLVVLAAGMGSRYGGLKQIDPVGSQGEAILDYSLFDAYEAGFETAVIIIKEAIRKDFMETAGKRLEKCPMEIRYAYQEMDKALPAGFAIPEGRTKPWGTSHAVLCAAEEIGDAPFAVINADDYYGKSAFKVIYEALCNAKDGQIWEALPEDTIVSMNFWGYTPSFLREIRDRFPKFLTKALAENPQKAEFYLPLAVEQLLTENKARVKVLSSPDKWYGVTYAADKPAVVAALKDMTEQGLYPDGLWK